MRRLLWIELNDTKWFVITLLALPWTFGLWAHQHLHLEAGMLVLMCFTGSILTVAFWGATRVLRDIQPNHLSVYWLPVNRWVGFIAKFMPGFIFAILLPAYILMAVRVITGHSGGSGYEVEASMACIYASSFAASMFLPSMGAGLIATVLDLIAAALILPRLPDYVPKDAVILAFAALMFAVCLGVWSRPASASLRQRASGALNGVLAGVIPMLLVGTLAAIWGAGGVKPLRTAYDSYQAAITSEAAMSSKPYVSPGAVVSPDGRSVAVVTYLRATAKDLGPGSLVISDADGRQTIIPVKDASPVAWLSSGDLLFYTGRQGRDIYLNRFDRRISRVVRLASFPPHSGQMNRIRPIISVVPEPSGDRVALVVGSATGDFHPDLWLLNTRTRVLRLIRPGLNTVCEGSYIAWDGNSIVIARCSEYWRIPLDGSRPMYVTDKAKEVRNG